MAIILYFGSFLKSRIYFCVQELLEISWRLFLVCQKMRLRRSLRSIRYVQKDLVATLVNEVIFHQLGTFNTIKATIPHIRASKGSYIHVSATLHYNGEISYISFRKHVAIYLLW